MRRYNRLSCMTRESDASSQPPTTYTPASTPKTNPTYLHVIHHPIPMQHRDEAQPQHGGHDAGGALRDFAPLGVPSPAGGEGGGGETFIYVCLCVGFGWGWGRIICICWMKMCVCVWDGLDGGGCWCWCGCELSCICIYTCMFICMYTGIVRLTPGPRAR